MNQLVTTIRQRSWMDMVRQQRSSGLSVKAWCQDNGISENCYYYRLKVLRRDIGEQLPVFAEIPLAAPKESQTRPCTGKKSLMKCRYGWIITQRTR